MHVPDSLLVEVGVAVSTGELKAIVEVVGLVTELATDIVPTELGVVEVTITCNELQMELSPTLTTRSKPTTKPNKKKK